MRRRPTATFWATIGCALVLAVGAARAQRGGGGGGGGGGRGGASGGKGPPPLTKDEQQRAATAAEWQDVIDKARASVPQHPPDTFKWPSRHVGFLARLRLAENPQGDLDRYLNKLWGESADPAKRRATLQELWDEAAKPEWVRPAVETFYAKRMGGAALQPPPEPGTVDAPAPSGATTTAKAAETKPAETKPAETKPAETKPAETKSAETKSASAKPPAEAKP